MGKKDRIQITSENCTGCLLCQLTCSVVKTDKYSYSHALIDVKRVGNVERFQVSLKPECDGCGVCISYCAYDAIIDATKPRVERNRPSGTSSAYAG